MPPEEAHGLVYLEGFFRAGQLWVQPTRIYEVKGGAQPPPLEFLCASFELNVFARSLRSDCSRSDDRLER